MHCQKCVQSSFFFQGACIHSGLDRHRISVAVPGVAVTVGVVVGVVSEQQPLQQLGGCGCFVVVAVVVVIVTLLVTRSGSDSDSGAWTVVVVPFASAAGSRGGNSTRAATA